MKRFLLGLIFTLLASPAFAQLPVCNNGDMIYRGSVGYQCVPFDNTAGKFLQGQGGAAAPIWSNQASQAFKLPTQSTNTFLGNTTGGTASPTPNSVSQILDTIGYDIARPPQPGALIYKSMVAPNNAWQSLAPTPNIGWVLVSGGLSNPPSWAFSQSSATPGVAGTCLISTGTTTSPTYQACLNALNFAVSSPIAVSFATPITTVSCPTCVTSSGGGAITGTAPVAVSAAGAVSCATCVTSSGGGALSGTAPISVSAAGVVSITSPLPLTNGGTNASLTASNGGLVYSTGAALAILAGTATANQIPLSGSSTTPAWSTATYPATTAAGTVLASASANTIAATPTPTLGANGGTGGQITLNGATSGSAALRVAAAAGTSTVFQLPATNGSNTNTLITDGAGNTSWAAAGSGTVTNVATAGLASGGPITTTGTITVTAASKSDEQTGSSATVATTPSQQQQHDSASKAWVYWTQSGTTVTVQANYNVSSVTRTAAGTYQINFTTAFASANYACTAMFGSHTINTGITSDNTLTTTTQITILSLNAATGAVADTTAGHVICFGRQ